MRRVEEEAKTLDYVIPLVEGGSNSYRNLVSCCAECNSYKVEKPAADFLRGLYRDGRLTAAELTERLRALEALAAGKLRPAVENLAGASADKEQAKHRPRVAISRPRSSRQDRLKSTRKKLKQRHRSWLRDGYSWSGSGRSVEVRDLSSRRMASEGKPARRRLR